MKVKIEFTVLFDELAWMEEFEVERRQVRDDVKKFAIDTVATQISQSIGKAVIVREATK